MNAAPPRDPTVPGCQVGELFRLLSRTHMLDVLQVVTQEDGPVRFVDIQRRLGISPNTLSNRLKALLEAGLATRTVYPEVPPRVDYESTDKARALRCVFRSLNEWAAEHDLRPVPA